MLSRGKKMLKCSILNQLRHSKRKRWSPDDDAKYWCKCGLDKDGFVRKFVSKTIGDGVFAERDFEKGDFLLEYVGDRISHGDIDDRYKKLEGHRHNYMYHYRYMDKEYCIDATYTLNHVCHFVNDAEENQLSCNAKMKLKIYDGYPRLCLFASRHILAGEQIMFDYGDKEAPWRKKNKVARYLYIVFMSGRNFNTDESSDEDPFGLLDDEDVICANTGEGSDTEEEVTCGLPDDQVEDSTDSMLPALSSLEVKENEDGEKTDVVDVICANTGDGSDTEKEVTFGLPDGQVEDSTDSMLIPDEMLPALSSLEVKENEDGEKTDVVGKHPRKGQSESHAKEYVKPKRFCIYCREVVLGGKLKRHISLAHKSISEVKEVLQLPREQQNQFFEQKRLEGMYEYNLKILSCPVFSPDKEGDKKLMRERKPKHVDSVRMCSGCKKFLSNRSYYKHQQVCAKMEAQPLKPTLLAPKVLHKDEEFVTEILSKLRDTEAGNLCRQDRLIQQIGYRHYCLRRGEISKKDEIRKAVMCEMREMARLFLTFKSLTNSDVTSEDMFTRKYLSTLREAIDTLSASENGQEKHGLKLNLNTIVQRAIKSLKGFYTETLQDARYDEVCKFQMAYAFRSYEMFANARYRCISNSMDKARRPEQLPVEEELKKMKHYISHRLKDLEKNFEISDYSTLRSLVVCRLTLYNGRRGEEPSRMLIKEWEDAMRGIWLPPEKVEAVEDPAEKFLLGQFHLAYLYGKGKKFVPVLIPKDVVKAVKILIVNRFAHGIRSENQFLFASKKSYCHCSGWHAVRQIAKKADVSINATRNRHRISTIYASLHMAEEDQKVFMDHMGHEATINAENYQCPVGLKEVNVMGKFLSQIDEGCSLKENIQPRKSIQKRKKPVISDSSDDETEVCETAINNLPKKRRAVTGESSDEDADMDPACQGKNHDDENGMKKTKTPTVNWTESDSRKVRDYFEDFFDQSLTTHHQNKGKLPSKAQILDFLKQDCPSCLKDLETDTAYKKTRAKLFNERKRQRMILSKNLREIVSPVKRMT